MRFLPSLLVIVITCIFNIALSNEGEQSSNSAIEGPCFPPPTTADQKAWNFLFTSTDTYTISLASKGFYRRHAEVLLGDSAKSCKELGEMNLKVRFFNSQVVLTGYKKDVTKSCMSTIFQEGTQVPVELTCRIVSGSPGTKYDDYGDELVSILWSDLEKTIVFGKCLNGNRLFSVWSKRPNLDLTTLATVMNKLKEAGYNPEFFEFYDSPCGQVAADNSESESE